MIEDKGPSHKSAERRPSSLPDGERPRTRLDAFMQARGIRPVALERVSGVTRPHLLRLRLGKADPGRRVIAAITRGCRKLTNNPRLKALDLFELE